MSANLDQIQAPPAVARTILCVDDEPNILSAMRRLFRSTGHRVLTAESGAAALMLLEAESVDLIISDMRMPMMSGAELLQQARLRWPHATRLLLTGYADMASTIAAINQGQIHRYIAKPWNDDEILMLVKDVFERQALQAEKDRLEALTIEQNDALKTLNATLEDKVQARTAELALANDRLKKGYFNSIKTFSNLIELRSGQLMGHARKVADLARKTAQALGMDQAASHEVFIAALMHDIGHIGLTDQLLATPVSKMTLEEGARYRLHPIFGEQALLVLDDMQPIAALIRSHHERHDGKGFPDKIKEDAIPLGARILAVADAYEDLQSGHFISESLSPADARIMLARGKGSQFDPVVLEAFLSLLVKPAPVGQQNLQLETHELKPGMVLAQDLRSPEGVMLLSVDHVMTAELILRLRAYEKRSAQILRIAIRPA